MEKNLHRFDKLFGDDKKMPENGKNSAENKKEGAEDANG